MPYVPILCKLLWVCNDSLGRFEVIFQLNLLSLTQDLLSRDLPLCWLLVLDLHGLWQPYVAAAAGGAHDCNVLEMKIAAVLALQTVLQLSERTSLRLSARQYN